MQTQFICKHSTYWPYKTVVLSCKLCVLYWKYSWKKSKIKLQSDMFQRVYLFVNMQCTVQSIFYFAFKKPALIIIRATVFAFILSMTVTTLTLLYPNYWLNFANIWSKQQKANTLAVCLLNIEVLHYLLLHFYCFIFLFSKVKDLKHSIVRDKDRVIKWLWHNFFYFKFGYKECKFHNILDLL
jgi:hypothetical protein